MTDLVSLSWELTPDNFLIKTGHGTWFIKHYAPWCPHCQALAPFWAELSLKYQDLARSQNFHFGEVNCDQYSEFCDSHGVRGYPTIYLYHRGKKVDEYVGATHGITELDAYLQNVTNVDWDHLENTAKFDFSKVSKEGKLRLSVPLFEKSFEVVDKWSFSFINFCDSKQELCQMFEPTWYELANTLVAEPTTNELNLAHVDCDTDAKFCKAKGIKEFPTLSLYQNASLVANYPASSSLDLESLKKFLVTTIEVQKKAQPKKSPGSIKPPTVELPPGGLKSSSDKLDKPAPDDAETDLHSKFNSRSSYVGSGNFTELTKEGIWFIQFRSPTPGSQPIDFKWAHLSNDFSLFLDKYGIRFGILECSAEKEFCKKSGATSFPTIQTYEFGAHVNTYDGTGSYSDLKAYIRENTHKLRSHNTLSSHIFSDALLPGIEGKTISLTESNFHESTNQGPWFVFFKTTTCKSCRSIVPEWEDLASRYKNKVNFAVVNCQKERSLCDLLHINTFPTLTFYKDGVPREYHGPYAVESFDKFATTASAPHLYMLDSKALATVLKKESNYMFYIYNELDSANSLAKLEPIVKGMYLNTDIYLVPSKQAINLKVPSTLPALQAYHNDKLVSEYTGPMSEVQRVKDWLTKAQFGPATHLDVHNFDLVMSYYDSVVLAIVEPLKDAGSIRQYIDLASSYSTTPNNKVGFAILDGIRWKEYVERVYQRKHNDLPFVAVTHPRSNAFETHLPNGDPIPFSGASLTNHIEDFSKKHDKSLSSHNSSNPSFTTGLLFLLLFCFVAVYYRYRTNPAKKTYTV